MRKRLIRKFTKAREGSLGYTMTELLTVIGIIAIVCAIAIPSGIWLGKTLDFKRCNDHARSIFLAAQQNLTEMRADGALPALQASGGVGAIPAGMKTADGALDREYVYTYTGTSAFELVLPAGSVDDTVRQEQIIVEYNPLTGNVYSVFYSEETESIATAYYNGNLPRDDEDARKDMMLGYYEGSKNLSSQIELEKTAASVSFENGQEAVVTVRVPMPDSFFGAYDKFVKAMNITLQITGEQSMSAAAAEGAAGAAPTAGTITIANIVDPALKNCKLEPDGRTVAVTYVLDSLLNGGSFANISAGVTDSLTTIANSSSFRILPGENITVQADVTFKETEVMVQVDSGIKSGINPMFEKLTAGSQDSGKYVLQISNGRNLQNLNALAPEIASKVESIVFTDDIYWNDTVAYYNNKTGTDYKNAAVEAPARALPYFVPVQNEYLLGTAKFIYPTDSASGGSIWDLIQDAINDIIGEVVGAKAQEKSPTLTDMLDRTAHATIDGGGHKVYNLKIDAPSYTGNVGGSFYATGPNQVIDYYFTGLFAYANTTINDLHMVNPIVKGHGFDGNNNPATGALLGVGGYNTLITNCSTYIDRGDNSGFDSTLFGKNTYSGNVIYSTTEPQNYGVSGQGAVGGLVGFAKSHRTTKGDLTGDHATLAFSHCFAAVPVSGDMRGSTSKHYGYSNGIGGLIGNSQMTNFYNCYASGNVRSTGGLVRKTSLGNLFGNPVGNWLLNGITNILQGLFGNTANNFDLLYDGRTGMGAGGFVGTSHGTRYTNCFSTGNVIGEAVTGYGNSAVGTGGFVGMMSIDETYAYGQDTGNVKIAQCTVFTNCYSVGSASTNGAAEENFSGANGRIVLELFKMDSASTSYMVGDYFRMLAPHYMNSDPMGQRPDYEDIYLYRDSYYLSKYEPDANESSGNCAEPATYPNLQDLINNHKTGSAWIENQITNVYGRISLGRDYWGSTEKTYQSEYFSKNTALVNAYREEFAKGYSSADWDMATVDTTHTYSVSAAGVKYPFAKIKGLDFYGDWPSRPSSIGLAYFEDYNDKTDSGYHYIFDKEYEEYDSLKLKGDENLQVIKDGYVIFSASKEDLKVTVGSESGTLKAVEDEQYIVGQNTYYVFRLTDDMMAQLPKGGEHFVEVTAQHGRDTVYTMYFHPLVAMSHVNPSNGKNVAEKPETLRKTMYVRSARQFAGISRLPEECWSDAYKYEQQLHIDAVAYNWPGETANKPYVCEVGAIGNAEHPFNASYVTAGGNVQQAKISGFKNTGAGLFGVIGTSGSLKNLLVETTENISVNLANTDSVAIIAGDNKGTIENVDLVIGSANKATTVALTGKTNAGLMAGITTGSITNCEVTAYGTVALNAQNVGGFTGAAQGAADKKLNLTKDTLEIKKALSLIGTNAGGFLGKALHVTGTDLKVTLGEETAVSATTAGGLAGKAEESGFTTVPVSLIGLNGGKTGTVAGALGTATNTSLTGVHVTATGKISGNVAAGFIGIGENADANRCNVNLSKVQITGVETAAGVAGEIGPQSVFGYVPAVLTGAKISAADAAGYASVIAADATVSEGPVTLGGNAAITGTEQAAGYVITLGGTVGNGSVRGSDEATATTISAPAAAGFAIEINGIASNCAVTPAANDKSYAGNSNINLAVNGAEKAAGFALNVGQDSSVRNCYVLGTIRGAAPSGFVGTNAGSIELSSANVTMDGGSAFAAANTGVILRCYGWHGGDETKATVREIPGKCFSSYFADLDPVYANDEEPLSVVLYDGKGAKADMTANQLRNEGMAKLINNGHNWYNPTAADGTVTFASYPYNTKIKPANYLYPMLHAHYGDWATPPQYAYGVAYYEIYENDTYKISLKYLSDSTITVEGPLSDTTVWYNGTSFEPAGFNNYGVIDQYGYAYFRKTKTTDLSSQIGETAAIEGLSFTKTTSQGTFTYEFFPVTVSAEQPGFELNKAAGGKVTVDTRFADAFNLDGTKYEVRTEAQLANIKNVNGNINQTHDITLTKDFETAAIASGKTYNGNGTKLTAGDTKNTWLNVEGTVQNLNLTTGSVTAPVFGTVKGSLSLGEVNVKNIGTGGALVGSGSGAVTVATLGTIEKIDGKLLGSAGEIKINSGIRVTGSVATLFEDVGAVTVGGPIGTGAVSGKLFGTVSGAVKTGAITTGDAANAQLFGNIGSKGSVTVNTDGKAGIISVSGAAKQLFGKVEGAITTGAITVTGALTQGFGEVSAAVQTGAIEVGAVTGANAQLFGNIGTNGSVNTSAAIKVNSDANQLFGTVGGSGVTTGAITVTGNLTTGFGTVSAAVQTGAIEVGSVTGTNAKLFGDVTSGSVNVKTGETPAAIKVNGAANQLFGSVGGSGVITGKITVTGDLTNGFGAVSAALNTGAIDLNTLSGSLIASASGGTSKISSVEVDNITGKLLGDMTGGSLTFDGIISIGKNDKLPVLFGTIKGTVEGNELNLNGGSLTNLFAGVIGGTVKNFQIKNLASMGGSLIGGDTMSGILENISLTATDAANVSGGLLTKAVSGTVRNCAVTVTNEVAVSGTFGGLTGSNSGTITGSSVTANFAVSGGTFGGLVGKNTGTLEDNKVTSDITVAGALDTSLILGGLAGTSTGTIKVTKNTSVVDVDIDYSQVAEATDQNSTEAVIIGGLVGHMGDGEVQGISGQTVVTGTIDLLGTNASGTGRGYTVGGVIGLFEDLPAAALVSEEELAVMSEEEIAALADGERTVSNVQSSVAVNAAWAGSKTQTGTVNTGKGAVGMFVGYVGEGSFENCAAVDKDAQTTNKTFQFVGEAKVNAQTLENAWKSAEKLAADLEVVKTDGYVFGTNQYTTDLNGKTVAFDLLTEKINYVYVTLSGSNTYTYNGVAYQQTYGAIGNYYTKTDNKPYAVYTADETAESVTFEPADTVTLGSIAPSKTNEYVDTEYYVANGDGTYGQLSIQKRTIWIFFATLTYYDIRWNSTATEVGESNNNRETSVTVQSLLSGKTLYKIKQPTVSGSYLLVKNGKVNGSQDFLTSFDAMRNKAMCDAIVTSVAFTNQSFYDATLTALNSEGFAAHKVTQTGTIESVTFKVMAMPDNCNWTRPGLDAVEAPNAPIMSAYATDEASIPEEPTTPADLVGGETQNTNP